MAKKARPSQARDRLVEWLEQLMGVFGIKTHAELSLILGVPRSTLANWIRREGIGKPSLRSIAQSIDRDLDDIISFLSGEGIEFERVLPSPEKVQELLLQVEERKGSETYNLIDSLLPKLSPEEKFRLAMRTLYLYKKEIYGHSLDSLAELSQLLNDDDDDYEEDTDDSA